MTDQELADALVARGIGSVGNVSGGYYISGDGMPLGGRSASHFVRDWRVAGACLEQWPTTINVEHLQLTLDQMLRIPVAICEAFVKALESKDE